MGEGKIHALHRPKRRPSYQPPRVEKGGGEIPGSGGGGFSPGFPDAEAKRAKRHRGLRTSQSRRHVTKPAPRHKAGATSQSRRLFSVTKPAPLLSFEFYMFF